MAVDGTRRSDTALTKGVNDGSVGLRVNSNATRTIIHSGITDSESAVNATADGVVGTLHPDDSSLFCVAATPRYVGNGLVEVTARYREVDPHLPSAVYVFTCPREGKQQQVTDTVTGLSDANGIDTMVRDATESWADTHPTEDGLPIQSVTGQALDDSSVRINAVYQHIYGIDDTYTFTPDDFQDTGQQADQDASQQAETIEGLDLGKPPHERLREAVEIWAANNPTLGGLELKRVSGQSVAEDKARVQGQYGTPRVDTPSSYVWTCPRAGKQQQVVETIKGLTAPGGDTDQMVKDAVETWAANPINADKDGVPLLSAAGEALDDTTVRIQAVYQHTFGIGDSFTFSPQNFKAQARQAETLENLSNPGTHQMVQEAVTNWAGGHSSLGGLALDRATGQAVDDDKVRVEGVYSDTDQFVGSIGSATLRGQISSTRVPRWKDINETDWLRKNDDGDPVGTDPVQQTEPVITVSYTAQQSLNPLEDPGIAPIVGKFNSDGFQGAEKETLLFEGAGYAYFPSVELYIVTFNLKWRPLGWTEDHMDVDETLRPLKDTFIRVDKTINNTASFGTLPSPTF